MDEEYFLRTLYRPGATPSAGIPLGTRGIGHYRVKPGWRDGVKTKYFVEVFWSVAGRGALVIRGEQRFLPPGWIAIYLPGMEHRVYALDEDWEYRWWAMDGPLAVEITSAFGLAADVYRAGAAPVAMFHRLERAIADVSIRGERRAGAVAYEMLSRIASGPQFAVTDPLIEQALRIIHRQWSDSQLAVGALARNLHLHRSTFSRRFHAALGISPVEYITRLRMQNAAALLKQPMISVSQVARRCGYDDPSYFARLIRRRTGLSPLQIQKKK